MLRLHLSPWLVPLSGSLLYLTTTAALLVRPGQFPVVPAQPNPVALSPNTDPSWRFRNPEFEQWIEELRSERDALAVRERQLQEFQKRLEAEREEILSVTQTVHQLQAEFDKTLVRFKTQDLENVKRQTKVITGMSPEGAAAMLKEMSDDQIVRILFTLKSDVAAPILDALSRSGSADAKRAADVAERLRQVLPPERNNSGAPPPN